MNSCPVAADGLRLRPLADEPAQGLHDVEGAEAPARLDSEGVSVVVVDYVRTRYGRAKRSVSDMRSVGLVWFGVLVSSRRRSTASSRNRTRTATDAHSAHVDQPARTSLRHSRLRAEVRHDGLTLGGLLAGHPERRTGLAPEAAVAASGGSYTREALAIE